MVLRISGSPATVAGDAASLLSEIGAFEVSVTGFEVSDMSKHKSDATASALADAKAKAKRIADAMGVELGEPYRVQYGEGLRDNFRYDEESRAYALTVSAPRAVQDRITPKVGLSISTQPIDVREKVTAAFIINKPTP